MSEWLDNQKKANSNLRKLLQERLEKTNPRYKLTTKEAKSISKLKRFDFEKKWNFYNNVRCVISFLVSLVFLIKLTVQKV